MRTNWDNNNWTNSNTTSDSNFQSLDVTKLPGYQVISSDCPTWKRPLIEKRNKQIEEDAMRELLAVKQEEQKWKDIPDWKKTILLEKEKKRQQEMAPYIAENRRMEEEMTRLQSLPEWKRNLLLKKRGDPM